MKYFPSLTKYLVAVIVDVMMNGVRLFVSLDVSEEGGQAGYLRPTGRRLSIAITIPRQFLLNTKARNLPHFPVLTPHHTLQ